MEISEFKVGLPKILKNRISKFENEKKRRNRQKERDEKKHHN